MEKELQISVDKNGNIIKTSQYVDFLFSLQEKEDKASEKLAKKASND